MLGFSRIMGKPSVSIGNRDGGQRLAIRVALPVP
jgi:hypothetical protein